MFQNYDEHLYLSNISVLECHSHAWSLQWSPHLTTSHSAQIIWRPIPTYVPTTTAASMDDSILDKIHQCYFLNLSLTKVQLTAVYYTCAPNCGEQLYKVWLEMHTKWSSLMNLCSIRTAIAYMVIYQSCPLGLTSTAGILIF